MQLIIFNTDIQFIINFTHINSAFFKNTAFLQVASSSLIFCQVEGLWVKFLLCSLQTHINHTAMELQQFSP